MQHKIIKAWWIDSNKIAVVFDKDITFVPNVTISTEGYLPDYKIYRARGKDFARYSSYYIGDGEIHFLLDNQNFSNVRAVENAEYYVCGDFNGWEKAVGNPKWKLKSVSDGNFARALTVPLSRVTLKRRVGYFKFAGTDGRWLEPRASLPNFERDKNGNSNLRLSLDKSGLHVFVVEFDGIVPLSQPIKISFPQLSVESEINPSQLLLSCYSDAPLGVDFIDGKTRFSIFAPRATNAYLLWKNREEEVMHLVEATTLDTLVWTATVDGDLSGARYFWSIDGFNRDKSSDFDKHAKVADPYANAMTRSDGFSIVKFDRDLPTLEDDFTPPSWHNLLVAEVHLRDILAQAKIDLSDDERLTFSGLTKWLKSKDCYLRQIGTNCVELQPIQEFTAENKSDYEWGYMPVNWFAPASSYATSPEDATQNDEFADLVKAFHKAGIAVILDVVYNHVGEPNYLVRADKSYYFETNLSDDLMNFSGCGNDFRCNTPMARRMIIDSLKKLVLNYGVDGFRFDLAELIGLSTLKEIELELKKIKPSIILIAEPWSFRGHIAGALKDTGFASWNDGFREFMLSYARGDGDFDGFKYFINGSQDSARFAAQTVNYLESHDDKCLFDRITSLHEHPSRDDIRRYKMAHALIFVSLGIPMVAEGFDLIRTKYGKNNTYKDGKANELDYSRAMRFTGTCQWLRDFAKFRQSEDASALRIDGKIPEGWVEFFRASESNASAALFNARGESEAKKIFAAFNPTGSIMSFKVGDDFAENFKQIADIDRFDVSGLDNPISPIENGVLTLQRVSLSLWIEKK